MQIKGQTVAESIQKRYLPIYIYVLFFFTLKENLEIEV